MQGFLIIVCYILEIINLRIVVIITKNAFENITQRRITLAVMFLVEAIIRRKHNIVGILNILLDCVGNAL